MSTHPGSHAWPQRADEPHPWPSPKDAAGQLTDRFESADRNALGSTNDVAAIYQAIAGQRAPTEVDVREVRWLSPTLVMAYTRTRTAAYYYVLEKKSGSWGIVTYYLIWIT